MISPDSDSTPRARDFEAEAAEWLWEQEEGFSPERAQAFEAWCSLDPRHAAAVARVENSMALLRQMPLVRDQLEARVGRLEAGAQYRTRFGRRLAALGGLAAMLAVGGFLWMQVSSETLEAEQYSTGPGAIQCVSLSDGSIVYINENSTLQVRMTASSRDLSLTGGEAHFAVAHDTTRPFVVKAEGMAVRAVGTEFGVRVTDGNVEVLVVEGRVQLARGEKGPDGGDSVKKPQVAPGELAVFNRAETTFDPKINKVGPERLLRARAWQDRIITFSDVPLREIVSQFNARNDTQLLVSDRALGERRLGGSFDLREVDMFVRLMEKGGIVVVERQGEEKILLRPFR